ncbi:SLC13 family permease [Fibrobacter intestinalis]|uniref:Solute carrier family 13 (Sodium-dependent dicarboxylate transporter), member 2/3/5 n=1 Tax=Fibrobacter intestinalis TaxID=28122 RepID=A0A1T4Q6E5_9BACT|nr:MULTISPECIES: SLC13 family permease [Fibrobacter]PBC74062.1 sodium-dependent dicarboxylate transporter 2/3/5 [Fibrobacter sp. NR9]SJZ99269.1 solute carrier family 13 (sodium-dependent dicarboxylate transporter), member 2/3/5 [Fibrobacter intestinalis]
MTKAKFIKFIIATILAVAALFIPYESLGIDGPNTLNPIEIRVIAIFVMAALYWILQPFPIWTTSTLVIVLMILTVSNSAFLPFRVEGVEPMKYKDIMNTWSDQTIMLFLGGFFLAAAATKYKMDLNLARVLLKPFGHNPKFVLIGLMMITALFSMFMSNTATAAMMLAILAPVLKLFDDKDKGKAAFALAIPVGANIGGMGTPIGTPPNTIALGALNEAGYSVSFGQWMAFGVPYVIIMMLIAWVIILKIYPISAKRMDLNIEGADGFDKSPKALIVYATFALCVVLWLLGKGIHGINDYSIAMIPIAVFALTGVITKKDLNAMSWDVLWLVAGGFALGVGLQKTGLAAHLIGAIPFDTWPAFPLLVGCGIICLFMANFMSHSATAALLVPILIVVGVNCADNLAPLGGVTALLVAVAFASSLGMSMPISTPPNALAHATGFVDTNGMAKSGILLGIIGLILVYVMMFALAKLNFFGTPTPKSEPAKAAMVEAPAATLDTTVALGADSSATLQVIDSSATAIADSTAK